ncbi:1-deoxy-D-xylulose-5-phosphate synthase [Svornostia abyssi]|uniref:1-deoxy-D-xylulose-5-phosphate synthase n=1 Tax=Svornostia abyssi TaxID=2898438 RepID=A0ABY5PHB4_9ACTN|nr:1-deoxy-D-xylulose-5-phosphate synthase [Parviterribacteraceae bacterium J379]
MTETTTLLDTIRTPQDLRDLTADELTALAGEIRDEIIQIVSERGGHLSPNLGVVELTIALHRVFDSPQDVLLWDTGHQTYVHKLLTGRRDAFATLRRPGGLSGFPSQEESEHDWIENSHASTALSYAHGMAEAFESSDAARRVVAIVGDGALTGGLAYEGLANIGARGLPVVAVLNDNGRSYAPTVSRLSVVEAETSNCRPLIRARERHAAGPSANPSGFFGALGWAYLGPVDGHDLTTVEQTLRAAAQMSEPVVVHVVTKKGRGHVAAERDEEKRMHDVAPPSSSPPSDPRPETYTRVFSSALIDAAARDSRVHVITAAMPGSVGLLEFERRFPARMHDVGLAEQHAVTAAVGMAWAGLRPVVAVFSTFLMRAFDQINLDAGLHGAPVVFAVDRAGITGSDGPSHHGLWDLALLTKVPGLTVFAPSSGSELRQMLGFALTLDGPTVIRYPKGTVPSQDIDPAPTGRSARRVRAGEDVCLLAVGRMLGPAAEAADLLRTDGVATTVWDLRCVAPLDPTAIADARSYPLVAVVEDGLAVGGVASAVAAALSGTTAPLHIGVPCAYQPQGETDVLLADLGLDARGIAARVRGALDRTNRGAHAVR